MDIQQLRSFLQYAVSYMETGTIADCSIVSWGGKGKSGLAYGCMQNDVGPGANNQAAKDTFKKLLDNEEKQYVNVNGEAVKIDTALIERIYKDATTGESLDSTEKAVVTKAVNDDAKKPVSESLIAQRDKKEKKMGSGLEISVFPLNLVIPSFAAIVALIFNQPILSWSNLCRLLRNISVQAASLNQQDLRRPGIHLG